MQDEEQQGKIKGAEHLIVTGNTGKHKKIKRRDVKEQSRIKRSIAR